MPRTKQSQQNRPFKNNEGGFYKPLNSEGEQGECEVPDANEAKQFWIDMWSTAITHNMWRTEVTHNREAQWLKDFKTKMNAEPRRAEVKVTGDKMKEML